MCAVSPSFHASVSSAFAAERLRPLTTSLQLQRCIRSFRMRFCHAGASSETSAFFHPFRSHLVLLLLRLLLLCGLLHLFHLPLTCFDFELSRIRISTGSTVFVVLIAVCIFQLIHLSLGSGFPKRVMFFASVFEPGRLGLWICEQRINTSCGIVCNW